MLSSSAVYAQQHVKFCILQDILNAMGNCLSWIMYDIYNKLHYCTWIFSNMIHNIKVLRDSEFLQKHINQDVKIFHKLWESLKNN